MELLYSALGGIAVGMVVIFFRIRAVNREVDQKRKEILDAVCRIDRQRGKLPGEVE